VGPEAVRVLGIDPGGRVTGWGLVEECSGVMSCLGRGTIRPRGSLPERLRQIHEALRELMVRHRPGEVAVEEVFLARNFQSALALGEARGAALLAAASSSLEIFEYSAAEVKKAVAGYGRAEKPQVQAMVCRLLKLEEGLPADAADALAVAICHLNSRALLRLKAAAPPAPRPAR
jgi:crossover junction endodeoxyribonuclease RuvC